MRIDADIIEPWLHRRARRQGGKALLAALGCYGGVLAVLALIQVMAYFIIRWPVLALAGLPSGGRAHGIALAASAVVALVILILTAIADRRTEPPARELRFGPGGGDVIALRGPAAPSSPKGPVYSTDDAFDSLFPLRLLVLGDYAYIGCLGGLLRAVVFSGARLLRAAWHFQGRAWRLSRLELATAAALLAFLHAHEHRCPLSRIPDELRLGEPRRSLGVLQDIEGVLFLERDPPDLALSGELREELDRLAEGPDTALRS